MTLHEVLGVDRGADQAAIRRAFRQKAKQAHPDAGGSLEAFAELTRAVSVLSDERRRKVYEETGRIEDEQPDEHSAALQKVMEAIDFVLARVEEMGMYLDEVDVIGDAIIGLREDIRQIDVQIMQIERTQRKAREAAAKFRAKPGKTDRLGPMLLAKAAQEEPKLETGRREKGRIAKAIEILKEHEFGKRRRE
jgi:curved DNA-binding protein CbpA